MVFISFVKTVIREVIHEVRIQNEKREMFVDTIGYKNENNKNRQR